MEFNFTDDEESVLRGLYSIGPSTFRELRDYLELPSRELSSALAHLIHDYHAIRTSNVFSDDTQVRYALSDVGANMIDSIGPSGTTGIWGI